MHYCSFCGNQINEGSVFCANCGKPVAQHHHPVPSPVPPGTPPFSQQTQPVSPSESRAGSYVKFHVIERERLNMVKVELKNSTVR